MEVALRLLGEHHVGNALAAAAVALELGATPAGVAAALGAAEPGSRWRMELTERPDGVTVVNDAYNANPESMRAALAALDSLGDGGPEGRRRRTWAVLGRIGELGPGSDEAHAGVPAPYPGAPTATSRSTPCPCAVAGVDEALELLRAELRPGDVVLVKASRAAGLERLAQGLLAHDLLTQGPPARGQGEETR